MIGTDIPYSNYRRDPVNFSVPPATRTPPRPTQVASTVARRRGDMRKTRKNLGQRTISGVHHADFPKRVLRFRPVIAEHPILCEDIDMGRDAESRRRRWAGPIR